MALHNPVSQGITVPWGYRVVHHIYLEKNTVKTTDCNLSQFVKFIVENMILCCEKRYNV